MSLPDARDELALIAELGVAFAGFVSIFLIFARREGRFSSADSLRIRSSILSSLNAVFVSLAPLVPIHFGLEGATLWRGASLVGLAGGLAAGAVVAQKHFFMSGKDRLEVGLVHSVVSWGLAATAIGLLTLNVLGILSAPAAGPFLAALVCVLAVAATNFVTIVFQRLL